MGLRGVGLSPRMLADVSIYRAGLDRTELVEEATAGLALGA